jgi:hypothetical protein
MEVKAGRKAERLNPKKPITRLGFRSAVGHNQIEEQTGPMKSEITFRRRLKQKGLILKRRRPGSIPTDTRTFVIYDKQGYLVVGDDSPEGLGATLEEIEGLLDDPNSVLNKKL